MFLSLSGGPISWPCNAPPLTRHSLFLSLCISLDVSLSFESLQSSFQVRVLGMLHHPNIISYYDSFEEEGTLMIEMEYADGG